MLFIKDVKGKGRGVFTDELIKKVSLIEVCPMIVLPAKDRKYIDQTKIFNYYFLWGDKHKQSAIALGYGSLYNHSRTANADYESYYEEEEIHIIAYKDIKPGEEVTINYNNDPNSQVPMWFEPDFNK
ncbi:MAG: SET domain-containing protein [Chitinophagales bacterium]